MKRSILGLALGLAAAAALTPITAAAQNTDSDQIAATAEVATAINVARVADLDFGTVVPGFNRTIAVDGATAGHFQVTGGASTQVSLAFTALPNFLLYDDGTTVHQLPVSFTALHNTSADPTGGTTFDPAVGEPGTNLDATTGQLHVYVGGTVTVVLAQTAGVYTAQVELTAAYTGN